MAPSVGQGRVDRAMKPRILSHSIVRAGQMAVWGYAGHAGQSILLLSSRFLKICQKKSPSLPVKLDFFSQGCLFIEVLHSERFGV